MPAPRSSRKRRVASQERKSSSKKSKRRATSAETGSRSLSDQRRQSRQKKKKQTRQEKVVEREYVDPSLLEEEEQLASVPEEMGNGEDKKGKEDYGDEQGDFEDGEAEVKAPVGTKRGSKKEAAIEKSNEQDFRDEKEAKFAAPGFRGGYRSSAFASVGFGTVDIKQSVAPFSAKSSYRVAILVLLMCLMDIPKARVYYRSLVKGISLKKNKFIKSMGMEDVAVPKCNFLAEFPPSEEQAGSYCSQLCQKARSLSKERDEARNLARGYHPFGKLGGILQQLVLGSSERGGTITCDKLFDSVDKSNQFADVFSALVLMGAFFLAANICLTGIVSERRLWFLNLVYLGAFVVIIGITGEFVEGVFQTQTFATFVLHGFLLLDGVAFKKSWAEIVRNMLLKESALFLLFFVTGNILCPVLDFFV